jgi:Glyoxalase/Bleomycin resistance protein/Dioxygenase superfamily
MTPPGSEPLEALRSILPTRLVQLAYRVHDIEAAARRWAVTFGVGPFLLRRNMQVATTHRGEPAAYDHSAAFGQWGPLMVELIEVHRCSPDTLLEIVEHDVMGQLHHVACFVDDLDATSESLQARGVPLAMEVVSSSGIRAHFLDARAENGCLLELYHPSDHLRALYDRVRDLAAGWDGSDPVRVI